MNRIREAREKSGLTQLEAANLLNISKQRYSNYELDKREPDHETLLSIAELFNVSTDYLLGISDDPNKKEKSPSPKDGLTEFELTILQLLAHVPEDQQDKLASLIESALKMSGLLK